MVSGERSDQRRAARSWESSKGHTSIPPPLLAFALSRHVSFDQRLPLSDLWQSDCAREAFRTDDSLVLLEEEQVAKFHKSPPHANVTCRRSCLRIDWVRSPHSSCRGQRDSDH